jgi:hypothetical protein
LATENGVARFPSALRITASAYSGVCIRPGISIASNEQICSARVSSQGKSMNEESTISS